MHVRMHVSIVDVAARLRVHRLLVDFIDSQPQPDHRHRHVLHADVVDFIRDTP
eukprot:SAG22_NODE_1379_length_4547_cov_8.497752_3_plen_53_part_00